MIKLLSRKELEQVSVPNYTQMTRRDKLLRWAKLVRECRQPMGLYHDLEHYTPQNLKETYTQGTETAFALAQADPIFKDAGLQENASVADHMKFFALTQAQLHEFSCDCGGAIYNEEMAKRIQSLA